MSAPSAVQAQDGRVADQTRIVLRPLGSPLPLGLLALAVAGLMFSLLSVGALATSDGTTVAIVVLAFSVPLQLLACIFALLARDTVAGTAMGLFAGAWLTAALSQLTAAPGSTDAALGAFQIAVAGCMLVLVAGAAFGKAGPAAVVAIGSARFAVAGLYEITGSIGLEHAGGIVGFGLVAIALYSALATELEDVQGRPVLPLGRRAKAKDAVAGPFESQLERIEHEAGVRQQL
jgi:succinate-acetate transporter protein